MRTEAEEIKRLKQQIHKLKERNSKLKLRAKKEEEDLCELRRNLAWSQYYADCRNGIRE